MKRESIKIFAISLFISGLIILSSTLFVNSIDTGENIDLSKIHLYYGNYQANFKTIKIDSLDPNKQLKYILRPLNVGKIDQESYVPNDFSFFVIHYSPNRGICNFVAEYTYNDRDPLTGFEVIVSWIKGDGTGTIDYPLLVAISKVLSYDPDDWLGYISITNSKLEPLKMYWLGVDISSNPIDISSGERFYILGMTLDSYPDSFEQGGIWLMGGNFTSDVYQRGQLYLDNNADGKWEETTGDLYFRTYTPSPQKPIVEISIEQLFVSAQATGIIILISSIFVFIRYLMVIK